MNKKVKTDNAAIQSEGLDRPGFDESSWDNLSEFQKQQISAGLDDIENGRVIIRRILGSVKKSLINYYAKRIQNRAAFL